MLEPDAEMHPKEKVHRALIHYRHFLPSLRKVSAIYGVGKSTLSRWASKACERVGVARKKRQSLAERVSKPVANLLAENPFLTLKEIVARIRGEGIQISSTTAHRALRRASFTRKRVQARFQPREPTSEEANAFLECFDGADEVISVDETCIYVNDSPRYGYTLKGTRCCHRTKAPKRTGKLTLVLAISNIRGVLSHTVIKGSCNTALFKQFIDGLPSSNGATVLMDNVAFHHSKAVKESLASMGLRPLFCPPYSPEFNPIEMAFGVLKAALRRRSAVVLDETLRGISLLSCQAWYVKTRRFAEGVRDASPAAGRRGGI